MDPNSILERIESPHQLRRLANEQLDKLAEEIRARIIDVVSRQGGHLASNLGVTELTIALHHVFDFSHDRLLMDVGHQCYAHKLLTRRDKSFDTLRQSGGLSGFPSPGESPYDPFSVGHAGTAISTAAGLAWADKTGDNDTKIVAMVGDAGIVNGLSMEGLNNVALLDRQFLIVLNDNSMAIDRTEGALAKAFDRLRMGPRYSQLKQSAEYLLQHVPLGEEISELLRHLRDGLRTTIHGGQFFESLGIAYFGPVDGHDIPEMIRILKRLSEINQPVVLHVHTQKGRGCAYAVEDPTLFHSPSAYQHNGDQAVFTPGTKQTWTQAYAETLIDLADEDDRIVAITAAMPDGTGLSKFRDAHPDRYIDVGMNESHAVAMAAGLAKAGLRPVVAIYSTFMQRAFDQIFQEAALQKLPIMLCMDRAGLVGSDGAVHHGFGDIAYLRILPGTVLMAPADGPELKAAMKLALTLDCPTAIRYPRDAVPADLPDDCPPFQLGRARVIREGRDGNFLAYGATVASAMEAAELLAKDGIDFGVTNARFAKPLDATVIGKLIASAKPLCVCEDHSIIGGFGGAVTELAAQRGLDASKVRLVGIPDRFVPHASRAEQLEEIGLTAPGLAATAADMVANRSPAEHLHDNPRL